MIRFSRLTNLRKLPRFSEIHPSWDRVAVATLRKRSFRKPAPWIGLAIALLSMPAGYWVGQALGQAWLGVFLGLLVGGHLQARITAATLEDHWEELAADLRAPRPPRGDLGRT